MRAIAFSEAQKASCGRRLRGVVWTTGRAETPEILLHRARCRRGRVLLSDKQADMQGDSAFFDKPAAGACQQDLLATTCLPHLGARSYADALKEARAEGPRAHQEQGYVGVRGSFLARSSRACLHGKGRETLDCTRDFSLRRGSGFVGCDVQGRPRKSHGLLGHQGSSIR